MNANDRIKRTRERIEQIMRERLNKVLDAQRSAERGQVPA